MTEISRTPEPPYFAAIFTSQRAAIEEDVYAEMASKMEDLASRQPGFLGIESVRSEEGFGITVSYWANEEAIRDWKANVDHEVAQQFGRAKWYIEYHLRISRVERAYGYER